MMKWLMTCVIGIAVAMMLAPVAALATPLVDPPKPLAVDHRSQPYLEVVFHVGMTAAMQRRALWDVGAELVYIDAARRLAIATVPIGESAAVGRPAAAIEQLRRHPAVARVRQLSLRATAVGPTPPLPRTDILR